MTVKKKPGAKPQAKRVVRVNANLFRRVVRVNANLFREDIAAVRKTALAEGVSTSIQLRQLVHEALGLKAYKFFVRADECVVVPIGEVDPITGSCPAGVHEISDVVAVCTARSQADALIFLESYAAREGLDSRWLRKATHVVEIPLNGPAFITWAAH